MYRKHAIKYLCLSSTALLVLQGCIGSSVPRCSSAASAQGYFCHQGYNFGKDLDFSQKEGIRDGCRTANGYFTKNYGLSASSVSYTLGWDKGRATCKPTLPAEADTSTMRTQYQQSIDEQRYYGN